MTSKVTTVIFDCDDVLCGYDFDTRVEHMGRTTGLETSTIVQALWDSGFDADADEGLFTADEYHAETEARLGVVISREDWAAARKAAMTPFYDVHDLVRRVAHNARTAGFTNNGPLMRDMMTDIFPDALSLFTEPLFFSCDIGIAKPKPEAYLAVLEKLETEPNQTLFVDDNESYIAGAKSAGLHVHRFTDTESLSAELQRFALI